MEQQELKSDNGLCLGAFNRSLSVCVLITSRVSSHSSQRHQCCTLQVIFREEQEVCLDVFPSRGRGLS